MCNINTINIQKFLEDLNSTQSSIQIAVDKNTKQIKLPGLIHYKPTYSEETKI
jgi:hypothetical protein